MTAGNPPRTDSATRERRAHPERAVDAEHALRVLEFDRVLERVAARATSDLGRQRIRELRPSTDLREARSRLEGVREGRELLDRTPDWTPPGAPDAREAVSRLRLEGGVLTGDELRRIGDLLGGARHLYERLSGAESEWPILTRLSRMLHQDASLESQIERTVGPTGDVLDSASTELRSLRGRLVGARNRVVRRLDAFLGSLDDRYVVPDASVSIREGRYVVPVRREGKGTVGGIVHGESATGHTLFVEPPIAIELMNEIRSLEREESREVQRILREWSDRLRDRVEALAETLESLVRFDSIWGRARCAADWDAEVPEISDDDSAPFAIVRGRHPLLLEKLGGGAIPFDLDLESEERILVVSGPNTGGKSVFLKSVGLIGTLAQAGVAPPVGAGTRLPVFASFFADIGDEQSISDNLSTFSARLANVRTVLERADRDSLILVDEMGTGTDPSEGAALARAILEELLERNARAVVTSHLGDLKRLATEREGVMNASLQFDAKGMQPTYRFVKGRPGRSYGIATARRLGMPETVLGRAEAHLADDEVRMEALLESLETKEEEASGLVHRLRTERDRMAALKSDLEAREAKVEEAERTARRRAEEKARALLLEARSEVEEAIRLVTETGGAVTEEVVRGARRQVESAADRYRSTRDDSAERESTEGEAAESRAGPESLAVGATVRYLPGEKDGTVLELQDGRAIVDLGGIKLNVPLADLAGIRAPEPKSPRRTNAEGWRHAEVEARMELDLRGKRVDEAEFELLRFLDDGILADLSELRIIHGKGTGALRGMVESVLSRDGRIRSHRLGAHGEGGTGVTVVTVR